MSDSKLDTFLSDGTSLRLFQGFALLLVPCIAVAAYFAGNQVPLLAGLGAVLAGVAFVSARRAQGSTVETILLSVALVGQVMVFNAALAGHEWQIDSHMVYFAMLAIIATLRSIPALLAVTAAVAVHHLTLGLFLMHLLLCLLSFGRWPREFFMVPREVVLGLGKKGAPHCDKLDGAVSTNESC